MTMVQDNLRLGTSGWSYDDWNGVFYPPGTSQKERLSHYASQFRTVEVDSTFYGIPTMKTVQGWFERTPDDFMFSAKFPRSITHERRLIECEEEAMGFVGVMGELGHKLGPLLLQLPPSMTIASFHDLERFFEGLPDGLAYAVEVRHRSWLVEEFADLLKRWNVAMTLTSGGAMAPFWRVTSRIAYIRWLGQWDAMERFDEVQIDRGEDMDWWIARMNHFLDQGGLVVGYVNNHYSGHAPATVRELQQKMANVDRARPGGA